MRYSAARAFPQFQSISVEFHLHTSNLAIRTICAAAFLAASVSFAETPAVVAKVAMTDSSASALAATKRVAITSVVVSFQASAGGDKTNTSGLLAAKTDASSTLMMPDMDTQLLGGIADDIYRQLQVDLQANGFEVVPESVVLASAGYQKIVSMAEITNFSKFANKDGNIILVGPGSLKLYLPYSAETGKFTVPTKSPIKGWIGGMGGKSSTEGGPSSTSTANIYALPGLEVELAKELNANLVKATYVVTLGSTTAAVDRFSSTTHNEYTGTAFAQVGLLPGQSRIAFRTPAASTKGESAPGGYKANFGNNAPPAKDGDVVASLAEPLLGGTDFFTLTGGEKKGGMAGFLGIRPGADAQFVYTATISDAAAYRDDVVGMVNVAQRDMLNLVKQ
jgi:hypothetical protein